MLAVPFHACQTCGTIGSKQFCPKHQPQRRSPSSYVTGTHRWRMLKAHVLRRDLYRCHYCGARATTVDHKRPVSKGGARYDEANLVAACKPCNDRKGGR